MRLAIRSPRRTILSRLGRAGRRGRERAAARGRAARARGPRAARRGAGAAATSSRPARRLLEPTWAMRARRGTARGAPRTSAPRFYFVLARAADGHAAHGDARRRLRRTRSSARSSRRSRSTGARRAVVAVEHAGLRVRRARRSPTSSAGSRRGRGAGPCACGRRRRTARVLRRGSARAARLERRAARAARPRRRRAARSRSRSTRAGGRRGAARRSTTTSRSPRCPSTPPVTPDDAGIAVERWYERYAGGAAGARASPRGSWCACGCASPCRRPPLRRARRRAPGRARGGGPEPAHGDARCAGPGRAPGRRRAERREQDDERALGLRPLGLGLVVAVRPPRDPRRPRGLLGDACSGRARYTATYLARATTPGTFVRPPAHAEEMYNPARERRAATAARSS